MPKAGGSNTSSPIPSLIFPHRDENSSLTRKLQDGLYKSAALERKLFQVKGGFTNLISNSMPVCS